MMKTRRMITLMLAIVMMLGVCALGAAAKETEHPDLLAGDADRDGNVTILDATKIQRALAELVEMDEMSRRVAKNEFSAESLTILDATNIQRWLADLTSSSTYEVKKPAFIWKDDRYISVTEDLKTILDAWLVNHDFYGVLYLTRNGRVLYSGAGGRVTQDITIDTQFGIGSVSKQFCATAIMLLQERGLLSIDDTLEKYFPEYEIGKDISLRNLLNMRSGIIDFINQATPMEDYDVSVDYTAEQNKKNIMDWLFKEELYADPDYHFSYCNTNYFLLAEIVGQVSGMEYKDFIRQNIFEPLHMEHSGFYEEMLGTDENLAEFRIEGVDPMDMRILGLYQGAGDIVSCAKDMDKWLTSFKTGALLNEESMKEFTTPVDGYGFGVNVEKNGALQHSGSIVPYFSTAATNPAINCNFFASSTVIDPGKGDRDIRSITSYVMNKFM